MVSEDLWEILDGFVAESLDNLDDNEIRIGRLGEEDNAEDLKALFRVFHTLKGLSGFFELKAINKVTHEAETLLDIFRSDPKPVSQDTIDMLYMVFDFLHSAIEFVGKSRSDDEFHEKSVSLLEQLTRTQNEFTSDSGAAKQPRKPSLPEPDDRASALAKEAMQQLDILAAEPYTLSHAKNLTAILADMKNDTRILDNNEMLEIIDSSVMILESIADNSLPAEESTLDIIKSDLHILQAFIAEHNNDGEEENLQSATAPAQSDPARPEPAAADNPGENGESPVEKTEQADSAAAKEEHKNGAATTEIAAKTAPVNGKESHPVQKALERKDVRVSTDKLNRLFDLVGEIITTEAMVVNSRDLAGLDLPNFSISANMLNKLTRELQSITMAMRMIPLDGLFNKMIRMVRDISRKFDKKIEINVYGQETEMDKNVIEEISDPLVHIIRNSIDHGIEKKEKREETGKNETGRINLGASYQGNEIHIVIEDDGAGLNRGRIIEKGIERGLVTGNPDDLSDKEVWQMIFEPGLSTAKQVTDISGRGVGMDVVKKNIEKLRGSIDIESAEGRGTRITLRIPLTLAIMDSMIVRVGKSKYAIPILSVHESFQPVREEITRTMDGISMVRVRKDLYPVVRLHEVMRVKPDSENLEKGILIMVSSGSKKVCLLVDEILDQQQTVVKPLSEYIGDVRGVTGCMVMADGKIGLILDVDSLIEKAENFVG